MPSLMIKPASYTLRAARRVRDGSYNNNWASVRDAVATILSFNYRVKHLKHNDDRRFGHPLPTTVKKCVRSVCGVTEFLCVYCTNMVVIIN